MKNCRDVAYLITSDGVAHADWGTRLRTRVHLLYCKQCRRYSAALAMLGRAGREARNADAVDPETLQRLERSIMDHASGGHDEPREDVSS